MLATRLLVWKWSEKVSVCVFLQVSVPAVLRRRPPAVRTLGLQHRGSPSARHQEGQNGHAQRSGVASQWPLTLYIWASCWWQVPPCRILIFLFFLWTGSVLVLSDLFLVFGVFFIFLQTLISGWVGSGAAYLKPESWELPVWIGNGRDNQLLFVRSRYLLGCLLGLGFFSVRVKPGGSVN